MPPLPFPYPYAELEFRKDGTLTREAQLDALLETLTSSGPPVTDLVVVSHGWNNDMDEARHLYRELFASVRAQAASLPQAAARRFAVAGVLWPSKRFADRDLIPGRDPAGGAAGIGGDDAEADEVVQAQIDSLRSLLGGVGAEDEAALERARTLVPFLEGAPDRQEEFARIILGFLPPAMEDGEEEHDPVLTPGDARADAGQPSLLERLAAPAPQPQDGESGELGGGAAFGGPGGEPGGVPDPIGGAAGIGDFFRGVKSGAMRLLNYVTYYQMKARAGDVGRRGVNPVLRAVRERGPSGLRIHLVGHSFGARVVTSAVAGGDGREPVRVDSLSLLQAAFSHFSFSDNYARPGEAPAAGFFRSVVEPGLVDGPILISHTRNDRAVGLAYAVASRVGGQVGSALGDAQDPFGGLGSNGARATPEVHTEVVAMTAAGTPYARPFERGAVYNLRADDHIADHGDVRNESVAYALLHAISATGS